MEAKEAKTADEIKAVVEEYHKLHEEAKITKAHNLFVTLSNRLFSCAKQSGATTIKLTDAEAANREIVQAAAEEAAKYGFTIYETVHGACMMTITKEDNV